ncbi:MAG: LacI family DNA-binding transcriptional regulator [Anaerolineales bacterium]|nr:LacI family DNA-binding transcriptional regulator [Anaerolineales bacterium]
MPEKKRSTIKDVASLAGVSLQTVSRVINNSGPVSETTLQKVQQAILTLNYRPSLAARSLPGRCSYVIGFIVPYEVDYLITDPNLLAQISGADAEAHQRGYSLLLSTSGNSKNGLEAYERFVSNQAADGALVIETASSSEGSKLLSLQEYPYVSIGQDLGNPGACTVDRDNYDGGRQITQHLLDRGHTRIGIINGPAFGSVAGLQLRLEGHQQSMEQAGLSFDPSLMVYGDYTRRSGETATQQLLALPDPPTAIFALNDRMAMGAIRSAQKAGLRIPEDLAVAGFDDIPTASDFNPPLTTISVSSHKLGQTAARMLFQLIDGEPIEKKQVVLPVELVIREST